MRAFVLPVLLVALAAPHAHAQGAPVVTRLLGHDTDQSDHFGLHMAVGDDVVAVGSRHQLGNDDYGTVYVFRDTGAGPLGGWAEEGAFGVTGEGIGAGIGAVLAYARTGGGAADEVIAAGDPTLKGPNVVPLCPPGHNCPGDAWGGVYIFRHSGPPGGPSGGWVREAFLRPAATTDRDATGSSVALMPLTGGGLALATLWRSDVVFFEQPAGGTWAETARLPYVFTAGGSGPYALQAAPSREGALVVTYGTQGTRVLRRGPAGWEQQTMLVPADPAAGPFPDGFDVLGAGETRGGVEADADYVLAGSACRCTNQTDGSAHVWRFNAGAWVEEARLVPAVPAFGFGTAQALDLDAEGRVLAIVGSAGATGVEGGLHVFRREATGVWSEVAVVDRSETRVLGTVWTSWTGRLMVGYPKASVTANLSGVAYVVDLRPALATAGEDGPDAGGFALSAPSPNPSRGAARLTLTLPEAGALDVRLFNVLGQEVRQIAQGAAAAGQRVLTVETSGLPSGVYVVRATAGARVATARLVVAR